MLSSSPVACALPAKDMERAKAFYKEKLDLSPMREGPEGVAYECGGGTGFMLFESMGESRGDFTQMGFEVPDVREAVAELKRNGVVFEQYDFPGLRTVNGITEVVGSSTTSMSRAAGGSLSIPRRSFHRSHSSRS